MSRALESARNPYDEDSIWIERFLAGDQESFTAIYSKYYEKVHALCYGVLLNTEEANDATQEVFSLLYRKMERFDGRSKFSTWLYRVSINYSIQVARRRNRSRWETEIDDRTAPAVPAPSLHAVEVDHAMGRLSPDDRAVLTLFYWEELSLNEVAQALECSPTAAKTRLFRARERFRKLYEGEVEA